jgi:hypothetical protein
VANDPISKILDWIIDMGIKGVGFLPSARNVAEHHRKACKTTEEAIDSVIAWRTAYATGTGFMTGLGGIVTLPIAIPASLASSYALGANTAAAIAILRGYDENSDQVRTFVLLSLIGEGAIEVLRVAGVKISNKVTQNIIQQIPGKILIEINKKVGFRLVTKAGEKGVVNLMKIVPLIGGVVGAGFDSTFVNSCGKNAKKLFKPIE